MYIKITNWILLSIIPYDAFHDKKHKNMQQKKKYYTGHSSRVSEVENITFLNSFLKYSEK